MRKALRSAPLVALILFLSCWAQARVVNGNLTTTSSQSRRFTVSVRAYDDLGRSQGLCTGIIIAKDMILTAQHCFNPATANVQISFGLGGEAGFERTFVSKDFITRTPLAFAPEGPSAYTDGYLQFDADSKTIYDETLRARTRLVNAAVAIPQWRDRFSDLAIVKIPQIPNGYEPIEFYRGMVPFGELVILTGYGVHSRDQADVSRDLRWSTARVVGFYATEANHAIGWETQSPTNQQSCFGDSGGPLVVMDKGKMKLLGINAFTINKCANSNWYMNAMTHFEFIENSIRALRAR